MARSILMQTLVTGFSEAFSDEQTAVSCDTVVESKTVLPALTALNVAQLTTRTNDTDGVITLPAGHAFVTGQFVDIYWDTGGGGVRYGVTTSVAANAMTISLGAGDVLPTNLDPVTVVVQTEVNLNFDGDDMLFVVVVYRNPSDTTAKAHVDFQDVGDASIQEIDLVHEKGTSKGMVRNVNIFNISGGDSNVFTGNRITHVPVSHESIISAGTICIFLGYNA